jgi:hypothetical protein
MNTSMKTLAVAVLQAAVVGAMPAFGQVGGAMRFNAALAHTTVVIGLAAPRIGYEDRIPEGKVLDAQYAILHALMGYQGHYGDAAAADQALLARMDLKVEALNGPERATLDFKLGEVRHDRNLGVPKTDTKKFISLQQMSDRHRGLIRDHAARLTVLPKGALSSAAPTKPATAASSQQDLTLALIAPLNAIKAARTPVETRDAVARFNAAAAAFDKGYHVTCEDGASPGAALYQAKEIYTAERAAALAMSADQAAAARLLPDAATLATKADLDARFDGQGHKVNTPWGQDGLRSFSKSPSDPSSLTQNAPSARSDREPPAPGKGDGKGGNPGLFGMLGSLFAGLFRTLTRVAAAAFAGASGVVKAVLS